ncbi:hypothetical protein Dimus_035043 [Dionaea muscipula]
MEKILMNTTILRSQFHFPTLTKSPSKPTEIPFLHCNLTTHSLSPPFLSSKNRTPCPHLSTKASKHSIISQSQITTSNYSLEQDPGKDSADGQSRIVVIGAVSLGFALFLMGLDDQKALALGPEGPLMEEFWDNMRRYALYALSGTRGFKLKKEGFADLQSSALPLVTNPLGVCRFLQVI